MSDPAVLAGISAQRWRRLGNLPWLFERDRLLGVRRLAGAGDVTAVLATTRKAVNAETTLPASVAS